MALKVASRRMRSARSHGRHGGGGEIADMAASCDGSREPRTIPNLLPPAPAAFPALPMLRAEEVDAEEGLEEPGPVPALGLGKW
jgi:hypothetical protein